MLSRMTSNTLGQNDSVSVRFIPPDVTHCLMSASLVVFLKITATLGGPPPMLKRILRSADFELVLAPFPLSCFFFFPACVGSIVAKPYGAKMPSKKIWRAKNVKFDKNISVC